MSSEQLSSAEICEFFESLPAGRRELVWVRCERALGVPVPDFDDDELVDDTFDRVLTDMWCADQLERLVELGRLRRGVAADGSLAYMSE